MLVHRHFRLDDQAARAIVRDNPWAMLVTGDGRPEATHLPVLLDEAVTDRLEVVGHVARADPQARALETAAEVLLVFQGPHGYVSPSWYGDGPYVPTWNYVAVHARGVPELLEGEPAYDVLRATVERFEAAFPQPWDLGSVEGYARRIAAGTVCFRLRPTSVDAKGKLSQDKPEAVRRRVTAALAAEGPYRNPDLAEAMRAAGPPLALES